MSLGILKLLSGDAAFTDFLVVAGNALSVPVILPHPAPARGRGAVGGRQ